jgi:hypothetical protein
MILISNNGEILDIGPGFSGTSASIHNDGDILYIGPGQGGMFASIFSVLHDVLWCEENDKIPVVFWDRRSLYYNFYGFNGSKNVWEYYFQPVCPINPCPSHVVPRPFWRNGRIFDQDLIDQETRSLAQRLVNKYIKLNPVVQKKVDDFYLKHMAGQKTIGIHLRGTDKYSETPLVSPEKIISVALETADQDAQFLIASDEKWRFEKMKELLQNHNRKVIFYDCYRSESEKSIHQQSSKQPRCISGEAVIIEVTLLSKCSLLIHTMSCVSTGALYFNASLKNIRVMA